MVLCVHDERMEATGRWTAQAVPLCQRRPPSTQRRSLWNARRWVLDGGRRKVDTSERGISISYIRDEVRILDIRDEVRIPDITDEVRISDITDEVRIPDI